MKRGLPHAPRWAWVAMAASTLVLVVGTLVADEREAPRLSQAELDRMNAAVAAAEAAEPPVAAFLGDSYTAASRNGSDGEYVYAVAKTLGWEAIPFGQGGTGYLNPGQAEEGEAPYPARVPQVIAAEPDIVIVQGGGNDAPISGCSIAEPAGEVFDAVRAALPEARIVAVASVPGPGADRDDFARCATSLTEAAASRGVPVVDPAALGWLEDPALFADGFHLNAAGYAQFAELLAGELSRILAV